MRTDIISILPDASDRFTCNCVLNFQTYYEFIKDTLAKTKSFKKIFFEHIVQEFEKKPQLLLHVTLTDVKAEAALLELIFHSLAKMVEDEEVKLWALNLPMQPTVFFSTNAFHKLVARLPHGSASTQTEVLPIIGGQLEFVYSVLTEKYYSLPSLFSRDIVYETSDQDSELTRYYKAEIDTRFIEVVPEGELPEFPIELFQSANQTVSEKLLLMQDALPLDMFRFEGFGITTIKEVTVEYAVDNLKTLLLDNSMYGSDNYFTTAIHWLKIITGNNNIEFGIVPALYLNEKLVYSERLYLNSMLIAVARRRGLEESQFLALINRFFKNPRLEIFPEINEQEQTGYLKLLYEDGIVSYGVIPVSFGKTLVGAVELYSRKKMVLSETVFSRLDPVMPLLAQLLNNGIDEFRSEVDKVIKEKFTALQPSVHWKFNDIALQYIRDRILDPRGAEVGVVNFDNVYPLYGAIDIRNSTVERNIAANKDMQKHMQVLRKLLTELGDHTDGSEILRLNQSIDAWIDELVDVEEFSRQIELVDFFESDINPFLQGAGAQNKEYQKVIDNYTALLENESGEIYENRTGLEKSMQRVITAVNNYLDKMSEEIQQSYPAYFEKFRTDGVEYDIYVGQSMAPEETFSEQDIKSLRLLQLTSMAGIARFTAAIMSNLPVKVQTTQLIFIHSQPIDIHFRNDEKRFDVEGAYNIRYHIVKKRIDKVLIKDTEERLTQPGKIGLVYMNQQDAAEYMGYITHLQEQGILASDLEELELEDLQGVSGLRAFRVGIPAENEQPTVREIMNQALPVMDR